MKEITKTSRLAGQLEKLFAMLNHDFFNDELDTPILTIQSTMRAYGHYTLYSAWTVKGEGKREINIGAGTLDRPIELTVCTLLHEMCHMYNDTVLHIKDCSNRGVYHNKHFREAAEAHGLICHRSEKYGWSDTSSEVSDCVLEWMMNNNVQDILLVRNDIPDFRMIGGGAHSGTSGGISGGFQFPPKRPSSTRKYVCPSCGMSVRATRNVSVACINCDNEPMVIAI